MQKLKKIFIENKFFIIAIIATSGGIYPIMDFKSDENKCIKFNNLANALTNANELAENYIRSVEAAHKTSTIREIKSDMDTIYFNGRRMLIPVD